MRTATTVAPMPATAGPANLVMLRCGGAGADPNTGSVVADLANPISRGSLTCAMRWPPTRAAQIDAPSSDAPATAPGASMTTAVRMPGVIASTAAATSSAVRSGSARRGTAVRCSPTTATNRSAISTTTVASVVARRNSQDRGRSQTWAARSTSMSSASSPAARAARVTTATRAADHHDGCTTIMPARWPSARRRRVVDQRDHTWTGRSPTNATGSSMAASAAAHTSMSATVSLPQHSRRIACGPASIMARCAFIRAQSRPLGPAARHRPG